MTPKSNKTKGAPSQDVSTTPELTADEIRLMGESAARLLNEPIYQEAYEKVIQDYQDQWMMSQPHETNKRESLYNKIQAASDHVKELAAMVQATQALNLEEVKRTQVNPTFQ